MDWKCKAVACVTDGDVSVDFCAIVGPAEECTGADLQVSDAKLAEWTDKQHAAYELCALLKAFSTLQGKASAKRIVKI